MKNIKNWLKGKATRVGVALSVAMTALAGTAFAAEGDVVAVDGYAAVETAFQTGFQTMANKMLAMLAIIVPVALGVAGVLLLARKAMGWFKSMIK